MRGQRQIPNMTEIWCYLPAYWSKFIAYQQNYSFVVGFNEDLNWITPNREKIFFVSW